MDGLSDPIVLDRGCGTKAVIYPHGATLTSWTVEGKEMVYLSSRAALDGRSPIRGGIPIVFPHFGPWETGKPKHGFARILAWKVESAPSRDDNNNISVSLRLDADDYTRSVWNHDFSIVLEYVLRETELDLSLTVTNPGAEPFSFHALFHNYLRLSDVSAASVSGLRGLVYRDALNGFAETKDTADSPLLRIDGPEDRVYPGSPRTHLITDEVAAFSFALTKSENLTDTVVWNPWKVGAANLSDMEDDGYSKFLCVEAGAVTEKVVLNPGENFHAKQNLTKSPIVNNL